MTQRDDQRSTYYSCHLKDKYERIVGVATQRCRRGRFLWGRSSGGEERSDASETLRSEPELRLSRSAVSWLANQLLPWEEANFHLH